jgi:hypothetical protein
MSRLVAAERLPTANDGVDVHRIELKPITASAYALSGDYGGAAAKKGVEYNLTPRGAVQNSVGDHRHRFDRRMHSQQVALIGLAGESEFAPA